MSGPLLPTVSPDQALARHHAPAGRETLDAVAGIMEDVRRDRLNAVRKHAERLGDISPGEDMILTANRLKKALADLPREQRELLQRTADRIRGFAEAQRGCLSELTLDIPGGQAGHTVIPLERVGCYAPGGRYPLPSSVLMTAVTARAAGVREVWVASPKPTPVTMAAAAIADVDGFLAIGGAQAIAAFAYGAGEIPACDMIVGPGNRWVTAAKEYVSGRVAIDMLAGPSELLIIADESCEPALAAADFLAQAEHDPDARPMLIAVTSTLPDRIQVELDRQLASLPTGEVARAGLANGFMVRVENFAQAADLANRLAPEHLQLMVRDPDLLQPRLQNFGALFIGNPTGVVFGDYGAGPNHVLPTAGAARSFSGLSVLSFLRVRTWLNLDDPPDAAQLMRDAVQLARLEGLEAHARSAGLRLSERTAQP